MSWTARTPELWTASQSTAVDVHSIQTLGIPSAALMERAALAVCTQVETQADWLGREIWVLCGPGNNGADGFALARQLHLRGHRVSAVAVADGHAMAKVQEGSARGVGVRVLTALPEARPDGSVLIIDALLGTGSKGPPRPNIAAAIEWASSSGAPTVSVDLPSGVSASSGEVPGLAVEAALTVCFGAMRSGLAVTPGRRYAGRIVVADIGLVAPPSFCGGLKARLVDHQALFPRLKPAAMAAHKGVRGHVLVVGGSERMPGAAILSARSAMQAGAGLASISQADAACRAEMMRSCPELMFPPTDRGLMSDVGDVCVVGPGLDLGDADAIAELQAAFEGDPRPAVWDASALPLVPALKDGRDTTQFARVITPHPGEAAAMLQRLCPDDVRWRDASSAMVQGHRVEAAELLAKRTGAVVVLKGASTLVAHAGEAWSVSLAGSGTLATAGSGDCLAGLIAACLLRELSPREAAELGVELHGLVGERLCSAGPHPSASQIQAAIGPLLADAQIDGALPRSLNWPCLVHS